LREDLYGRPTVVDLGEYLARQLIARPEVAAAVSRTVAEYAPANRDISKREALL